MVQKQPVALRGWPNESKGRPDPTRDRFRHNLARIMAERGITQASLARTMDVSRVAVHAWIWGTCFPETSRLIKLAQALNVQVGALLENEAILTQAEPEGSSEEALLLNAFRKLPNTARLSLLADAYELSAKVAAAQAAARIETVDPGTLAS
jgi:transcriptional regulator with XRE-family HTH domain